MEGPGRVVSVDPESEKGKVMRAYTHARTHTHSLTLTQGTWRVTTAKGAQLAEMGEGKYLDGMQNFEYLGVARAFGDVRGRG
jgi:hypothetical protein